MFSYEDKYIVKVWTDTMARNCECDEPSGTITENSLAGQLSVKWSSKTYDLFLGYFTTVVHM
jgi:hypothetical protein